MRTLIDKIDTIWGFTTNTTSGGRDLVISTPNGVGNFFPQNLDGVKTELMILILLNYIGQFTHERGQEWRDEQDKLLGQPIGSRM